MAGKEFCGRTATVYLPSEELMERWNSEAAQYQCSISKYIFEMVERGRRSGQDETRPDVIRENSELKSRCLGLEQELKLLKITLQNAQSEIYKLRFGGFDRPDSMGPREYDSALVSLLQRGGIFDTRELLSDLGIDPKDGKAVQAVSVQLRDLSLHGLVKESHNGWRWVG